MFLSTCAFGFWFCFVFVLFFLLISLYNDNNSSPRSLQLSFRYRSSIVNIIRLWSPFPFRKVIVFKSFKKENELIVLYRCIWMDYKATDSKTKERGSLKHLWFYQRVTPTMLMKKKAFVEGEREREQEDTWEKEKMREYTRALSLDESVWWKRRGRDLLLITVTHATRPSTLSPKRIKRCTTGL